MIEAELTDTIGAGLHERSAERSNHRNGHRTRILSTTAGDLELRIPKLRTGSVVDSEDGASWTAFLRTLKARGLGGVQLAISDAHTGLKQAISAVLLGAAWQRCRGDPHDLRPTRRRARP